MQTYHISHKEPLLPEMDHGLPILVAGLTVHQVVKLSTGPVLVMVADARTGFWEFLHSCGETWKWEVMEPGKDTPADIQWIVEGLRNRTAIWATDGSYDQKKAAD